MEPRLNASLRKIWFVFDVCYGILELLWGCRCSCNYIYVVNLLLTLLQRCCSFWQW